MMMITDVSKLLACYNKIEQNVNITTFDLLNQIVITTQAGKTILYCNKMAGFYSNLHGLFKCHLLCQALIACCAILTCINLPCAGGYVSEQTTPFFIAFF